MAGEHAAAADEQRVDHCALSIEVAAPTTTLNGT